MLNQQNDHGITALILAITKEQTQVALALLQNRRVNANAQDKRGFTALIYAIRQGNLAVAQGIMKNPEVDVNLQSSCDHTTALMWAISCEATEIALALLAMPGIKVNVYDARNNNSALTLAAGSGEVAIFHTLLQRIDIDLESCPGHVIEARLQAISDPNKRQQCQALYRQAGQRHACMAQLMKDHGLSRVQAWLKASDEMAGIISSAPALANRGILSIMGLYLVDGITEAELYQVAGLWPCASLSAAATMMLLSAASAIDTSLKLAAPRP